MEAPLILLTNDDGIDSSGLWAIAETLMALGEVVVVAPDRQWSGGGRSMPPTTTGKITPYRHQRNGLPVLSYAVDGSPALVVQHGILELVPRQPSLVVSGVNYGFNLGNEVTVSGTVGAAIEAAAFGVPAMAVSLEMDPRFHLHGDINASYAAAQHYTCQFAEYILNYALPDDVDVLNINVPASATPETAWRLTKCARERYYTPTAPDRSNGSVRPGYKVMSNPLQTDMNSDIWATIIDRVVSVTPLSINLTARTDLNDMENKLQTGFQYWSVADKTVDALGLSSISENKRNSYSPVLVS